MKQLKWMGVLTMCAAIAYGNPDPYYLAVASGDKLLYVKPGETIPVIITESVQNWDVAQRHDFVINGTLLSVTLTNGIITKMVRDGRDIGIKVPTLNLKGNKEWVELSARYHAEVLRLLSFTSFLNVGEAAGAREVSIVGEDVEGRYFMVASESLEKNRVFGYRPNGTVMQVMERSYDKEKLFFSMTFGNGTHSFHISKSGLIADFFANGGLKSLYLSDPNTRKGLSKQEWNEKGQLIYERDLKKNPYPPVDPKDIRIRKGDRNISL